MADEPDTALKSDLIELTAGITQSYLENNQMQPDQVPNFIGSVHEKLGQLAGISGAPEAKPDELPTPPVKPQNSVRANEVVCLECGKRYKTLKRHIRTEHDLDEDGYKDRWGLPRSLKLVAKNYSQQRSSMAKQIGLGEKARGSRKGSGKK